MKWRIMGFSNRFIVQQSILESIIPIIVGLFATAIVLIVCQHTYEFILLQIRPFLEKGIGIKRAAFFSSNVLVESTPNQAMNSIDETHFLSLRISSLPIATILKAFSTNCLILLSTTAGVTFASTSFLSRNAKKVFRM